MKTARGCLSCSTILTNQPLVSTQISNMILRREYFGFVVGIGQKKVTIQTTDSIPIYYLTGESGTTTIGYVWKEFAIDCRQEG